MHTFCAFVDIRKAFDTSKIKRRLSGCTRLASLEARGAQWPISFVAHSQKVRICGDVCPPWVDTAIAQGRVLSPLLFNLLVKSLAAAIRLASPGVRLVPHSDLRFTCQLHADDLVMILADSEADLQAALDAVTLWGHQWRSSFSKDTEKSAAMVFGPVRSRPSSAVSLSAAACWNSSHPTVTFVLCSLRPCGGTPTSPTVSSVAIDFLHKIPRGPAPNAYLPPSPTSYSPRMFFLDRWRLHSQIAQLDLAQQRWGRHLLGWASGTPCASVLYELALPDSLRLSTGRTLNLFGRLHSRTAGARVRQCLLSRNTPTDMGPLLSLFSPTPRCKESSRFWCRATLLLSGHPPMGTSRCVSRVGSSMVSSSPSRLCPPL